MSRNPARTVLGTLTITDTVERTQHYECAAWWTAHVVQPGQYQVTTDGEYTYATVDTIIRDDYFPSLFGGVAIGGGAGWRSEAGKASTYLMQGRAYDLPAALADDADAAREGVPMFGGTFVPAEGIRFAASISPRDGRRYGTRQVDACDGCGEDTAVRPSATRCAPCWQDHHARVEAERVERVAAMRAEQEARQAQR